MTAPTPEEFERHLHEGPTLVEFLLARYDDEVAAIRLKRCAQCGSYQNTPNDPATARLLADIEAKRSIVSFASELMRKGVDSEPWAGEEVLVRLAVVYSDHPDYNPDWRP